MEVTRHVTKMSDRTVFGGNLLCDKDDGQIQETEEIESKFATFIFFFACLLVSFVCFSVKVRSPRKIVVQITSPHYEIMRMWNRKLW